MAGVAAAEFNRYTNAFQRSTASLVDAARARDGEAALPAYNGLRQQLRRVPPLCGSLSHREEGSDAMSHPKGSGVWGEIGAPDTPVRSAAQLIEIDRKIGCLPVLEGEVLIGMLSKSDVVLAVARGTIVLERRAGGLVRVRLDVQGDEHQTLADLLRPLVGEDEGATLAVDLGHARPATLVVAPGDREAEAVHIEAKRSLDA